MFRLLILIYVVLYAIAAAAAAAATAGRGLRVDLTHVDSARNFSKLELLQRASVRSNHRMSRLMSTMRMQHADVDAAASGGQSSPVHAGNGEFLMELSIGTPPVPFSAIVDTGSDLVWTQCKPCVECFEQPTPVFDPSSSSTFSKLPCTGELCSALPTSMCNSDSTCEYQYSYGDSSSTQGVLGSETFTFGKKPGSVVPNLAFGCGDTNQGGGFSQGSGLVGLGRGPLSLASQLGVSKFSYCLTSIDETSKKSPLLFGSLATTAASSSAAAGAVVLSTPISKNPLQPSFYYLSLKGISVGGTLLKIPSATFELQLEDGTGGLIIDSGTSITYLEAAGYKAVKKAFLSQVKLPVADGSDVGLDLCFSTPAPSSSTMKELDVEVPKLTFHFDGGADLELPGENYMVLDSGSGLLCLTMMGSTGMSIFGNFQQQNTQILYDLDKNTLSFVPTNCAEL